MRSQKLLRTALAIFVVWYSSCAIPMFASDYDLAWHIYRVQDTRFVVLWNPSYSEVDKKVDFTVMGQVEQNWLCGNMCNGVVGQLSSSSENINEIYLDNKKYKEEYQSFNFFCKQKEVFTRQCKSEITTIIEPHLEREIGYWNDERKNVETAFVYSVQRINPRFSLTPIVFDFYSDDALKEAAKDLARCYKNILNTLVQKVHVLRRARGVKIAFPVLSSKVGFPVEHAAFVAIKTVFEHIKQNGSLYSYIYLVTMTDFEYELCNKLSVQIKDMVYTQ